MLTVVSCHPKLGTFLPPPAWLLPAASNFGAGCHARARRDSKQSQIAMGGSALRQQAPRLSRSVYTAIVAELKVKLSPDFYLIVEEPRSFKSKTSFGDVDLLVTSAQRELKPLKDLGSSDSHCNGNIKHFDYKNQVDVIEIDEDYMELAQFFYGYGDTGMITGMFMRNIGLKFGMSGLTYKCETYKIKLSHNLKAILHFLGLEYDVWVKGFDSQEGMFQYMASSKYFRPYFFSRKHPEVLELDAQKRQKGTKVFETPTIWNHEARHRLAERPMFSAWVEYAESLPESKDRVDPEQVKAAAVEAFGIQDTLREVTEELEIGRRVKTKSNGKLAILWIDQQVTGKALGTLTAGFRTVYSLKQLDQMTADQIHAAFVNYYEQHGQVTS